jgi:hypothetical protein
MTILAPFLYDESLADELLMAAANADASQMKDALRRGAYVNAQFWAGGASPLQIACSNSSPNALECVEILLSAGADPDLVDALGDRPLAEAAGRRDEQKLMVLLRHGAKPETANRVGCSPLMKAAKMLRAPCVEALLKAGAPWRPQDQNGRCALFHAIPEHLRLDKASQEFWTCAELLLRAAAREGAALEMALRACSGWSSPFAARALAPLLEKARAIDEEAALTRETLRGAFPASPPPRL